MAKTRRPLAAKKKSPAKKAGRSKPVKKAVKAPRKTVKRAKAAKVKAVKKVELKELRKQFASVLAALSTRQERVDRGIGKARRHPPAHQPVDDRHRRHLHARRSGDLRT